MVTLHLPSWLQHDALLLSYNAKSVRLRLLTFNPLQSRGHHRMIILVRILGVAPSTSRVQGEHHTPQSNPDVKLVQSRWICTTVSTPMSCVLVLSRRCTEIWLDRKELNLLLIVNSYPCDHHTAIQYLADYTRIELVTIP